MDKESLLEIIEELPDDVQIFICTGNYDDLDIRIFTEEKSEDFLKWYFLP